MTSGPPSSTKAPYPIFPVDGEANVDRNWTVKLGSLPDARSATCSDVLRNREQLAPNLKAGYDYFKLLQNLNLKSPYL
jgi:hypothetical protein